MTSILFIALAVPDALRTGRKQPLVDPLASLLFVDTAELLPSALFPFIIHFTPEDVKAITPIANLVYSRLAAKPEKRVKVRTKEHR